MKPNEQPATTICGCEACVRMRRGPNSLNPLLAPGWRYACEVCGNKRCPHHADHNFACTNSNESGQVGVVGSRPLEHLEPDCEPFSFEEIVARQKAWESWTPQDAADLANGAAWRKLVESGREFSVDHSEGVTEVWFYAPQVGNARAPTLPEAVAAALGDCADCGWQPCQCDRLDAAVERTETNG